MNRLRSFLYLSGFLGFLTGLFSCSSDVIEVAYLIKNGKIVDGSGNAAFFGDIGIKADTIAFIGDSDQANIRALKIIDAAGAVVSPGFIDPHTHAWGDLRSETGASNLNYLTQGVTTVFVGNDGGGPFDITAAEQGLNGEGIGTNVAFFVGHGTVREEILGREDVAPNDNQLERMKALVRKGMEQGALGLSTGLYYAPGSYATTEEVIELTKEIVPFGGVYDTHMRDESTYNIGLLNAVKETLEIGDKSGAALHFGHIKALGVDVWGQSSQVIALIEEKQQNGMTITADQYPWQASGTHLENAVINRWVMAGGDAAYYKRLDDEFLLPKIREEIKENIRKRGGAESLLITADYKDPDMIGLNLAQIADKLNLNPVEAALVIARNGGARVASFNMSEEDIANFMVKDWVMTSSDGTKGHPRKFGSFPQKYQKYVQWKKLLNLESFVKKSSSLPAQTFHLSKRGQLKVGYYADVILFSETDFKPQADFSSPDRLSRGIQYVFVNGRLTIEQEKYVGALEGRVLKKNESSQ